ncbi:photosystem I P700 chlorophyll A apoprotein, partial [Medicago truncatula]
MTRQNKTPKIAGHISLIKAHNLDRTYICPNGYNLLMVKLHMGPGDFLVHHAIALGLHTTTLILVKGALDARGSKLMPDKKDFGYSFPCDGPRRGGTCDISAWDAFYLAIFWMLNTIGWVTFYWHWKHITLWQGNVSQFNESSTYLMGWLRDYLWLNSSQLINGYNPF